jgi:HTH-type transcriptional repressor of NAD biosynthesis genes
MARQGLVLGKFLPPHAGHVHLVETARSASSELTVLVCSLEREPIPGALRHAWMCELFPSVRVVHVDEELPQEPADDPEFWPRWISAIRRHVPMGPDLVFTSEDYGDELARRLGARHVLVDRERRRFPISGTLVRADPLAAWTHLPAPVRAHFVKRVAIFGSESTGKTVLTERLARDYATVWVPEHARAYLDAKGTLEAADIDVIARGQLADEDRLARRAERVLFCDTELETTVIYAEAYFGAASDWLRATAAARRYDLILFCDIDVPWVSDRWRDFGDRRAEMHARFAGALARRATPFVRIAGDWDERHAAARRAVDSLLVPSSC